ncbi:MAG: prepilin-type N-terminal cleavage/methylation domain-containing protein [Desulfobacterales bacterium]|jgi:general secretion pathway protein J
MEESRQMSGYREKMQVADPKGFTLLEILVALLIFGVVMSSLFLSFRSILFDPQGLERRFAGQEMARNALDRIVADLQSISVALPPRYRPPEGNVPPDPQRLEAGTEMIANQEFSRLRFASLAHLPMRNRPERGIAQIVYYVQAEENDTFVLRRSDQLEPYPATAEVADDPILCSGIRSLAFRFISEDGDSFDTWNSETERFGYRLPASVAVRIELAGEGPSPVFETQVRLPVQREISG